jgi:aspartyl-tRNA(Asn)/glutamyl-tRNA(Gln) amidotransferase subunit A
MTAIDADIAYADIVELGDWLRSGEVTAVALAEHSMDMLESRGRRLNAVVTITAETALAQAERADAELAAGIDRGPLHGIPYGAKDLLAAKGDPTTWGAFPFRDRHLEQDATVILLLTEAGAVLVGKLAMVELAGGFGYDQPNATFTGPGRNAWNAEYWAGGSSSGSGAAVAAGCVPLAIGSETWGSIHVPAAFNGVSGFRPTYGLVSRNGAMALSWSMDKIGPIARSAADCELALMAIARPDPADPVATHRPAYRPDARRSGFRFAMLAGVDVGIEPEVAACYLAALEAIRELGPVEEIELPELPFDAAAATVIAAEAASAFEDFLESGGADELTAPEDRVALLSTLSLPAVDYLRALRVRRKATQLMNDLLEPFDAVIAPAHPRAAPHLSKRFSEEPKDPNARTIGGAANLCGLPGIALPAGFGRDGLPASVSLTGRVGADPAVLAAGIAFQQVTGWHRERPPEPDHVAPTGR